MNSLMHYFDALAEQSEDCSNIIPESLYTVIPGRQIDGNKQCEESSNSVLLDDLSALIARHPILRTYKLQQDELMMIARICHNTSIKGELHYSFADICSMLTDLGSGFKERYDRVSNLLEREIISFSSAPDTDFHSDLYEFIDANFRLNGLLCNLLMGRNPIHQAAREFFTHQKNGDTALDAALQMIMGLFMHYPELQTHSMKNGGIYYGKAVNRCLELVLRKITPSSASRWMDLVQKHQLDVFWQKAFLLILFYNRIIDDSPEIITISILLAKNRREYMRFKSALGSDNPLRKAGLLEEQSFRILRNSLELSEKAIAELFNPIGQGSEDALEEKQILRQSSFLSIIDPGQTMDQLILDMQTHEVLGSIIHRLHNPEQSMLSQWGLMGASLSGDSRIQKGCCLLLQGAPGTGKTFIAGVIANELKRPLIQINAANIRNCYYGNTEKQVKELFQEMRVLANVMNPVFLLNEGDQLIHQRNSVQSQSTDHTENAIQSIFLEEMESFTGMLIVTTNLQCNLDEAMSRRFHYKLEIKSPDYAARLALWRLHLPATIPGASDIPLEELAREFCFSGGQIRIVVQNACYAVCQRGSDSVLTFADLNKYATLENGSSFEKRYRKVGFGV